MAGFDNNIILRIQQANDIVDVVSEHVSLNKKGAGSDMVGLCCFHDDHSPSMYVSEVKQIFKCFACGAGGDVFKFVQLRENLTFPQAVERLAERANIKLEKRSFRQGQSKSPESDVDPNMLARVNEWGAKLFERNLAGEEGKNARDYLEERQISQESVKKWRIGYAGQGDGLIAEAKKKKIPVKLLVEAGLVVQRGSGLADKFVNRVMFPITDVTGRVIGFGGRTLDDHPAKYLNSPATVLFDKSNCLYGLHQARHKITETSRVVLVEGYTDCIMPHQFGIGNVVASLGTSLTAGHGRMLRRYAKKVILLYDNDIAGVEASNKALEICLQNNLDIKIASVKEGKDPCDFVLKAGREKFEQMLEESEDVFEFKWNRLMSKVGDENTLRDKKGAIEEFLQTAANAIKGGNLSAIERGLIVNRLSSVINLPGSEINSELRKLTGKGSGVHVKNQKVQSLAELSGGGVLAAAQREVLEVLLNEPKRLLGVKKAVDIENFNPGKLRQAAEAVFGSLSDDPEASLASILARVEEVELSNFLVDLAQAGYEKRNFEARLEGALKVIEQGRLVERGQVSQSDEDQREFLKKLSQKVSKQNPHSVGMN